jgi:arylsulfatase A-like enzyme
MRHARLPARVREEHSETAYMTDRTIALIESLGETPWCIHLSYIKPHWPYIAPAPYHDRYSEEHVIDANRSNHERTEPHPVVGAFMRHGESECFAREEVRQTVIPTYMGLTEQIDDHLGRLFVALEKCGRVQDTLVVFTSDHGDYLGDHWLGEKDLFHEEVIRIPLIIVDPTHAGDATRGATCTDLVEAIDLLPTFVEALGGEPPAHRLEGRSLMPLLHGAAGQAPREAVFCDSDFSLRHARHFLDLEPHEARGFMARTVRWKYVEYMRHAPQLFDLNNDPHELVDLGADSAYASVRAEMAARLHEWMRSRRLRTTKSDEWIRNTTGKARERGYDFGIW